jgi:uncharacterized protein (DUF2062 family)
MQPIRPLLPGLRLLHYQLRPCHNEHSHQSKCPSHRPKKVHQVESSSLKPRVYRATLRAQSILSEVHLSPSTDTVATEIPAAIHHNWIYRRVALPILALLRMGASPEKLAWSIAAGLLIGINPILGSTTIVCLAIAFVFRLNVAASQIGNHIVYPLELLLIIPFIKLASRVFHTEPMPLSATELLHAAREHPINLTRHLWLWEWHAFLLWAILAAVAIPLLALLLTPILRSLLVRVTKHQYPILSHAKHPNI